MIATTWIVAADDSRARVLQAEGRDTKLVEIEDLVNPAGRQQDHEMQTDAEPRFSGHGGVGKPGTAQTGGTASDRETQGAVEHSVAVFARDIGRYLEKARVDHRYDKLVLVAPPKFLGALRKELGKEVEKLVVDELPKDVSGYKLHDLQGYFDKQ
ncbi:MAG: host attachment protein [Sulfurifustaceae bacterium]